MVCTMWWMLQIKNMRVVDAAGSYYKAAQEMMGPAKKEMGN